MDSETDSFNLKDPTLYYYYPYFIAEEKWAERSTDSCRGTMLEPNLNPICLIPETKAFHYIISLSNQR